MRVIPAWAATIAAILLSAQVALAGGVFPKVLVAPPPLKPYVDEIMKGTGTAQSLLRPGQDAHDFALSPSQAEMLAKADILIVPDLGMNPLLNGLVKKYPKLKVIALTELEGADPLPYAAHNPWLEAQKKAAKKAVASKKAPTDNHSHEAHDHADADAHEHAHGADNEEDTKDAKTKKPRTDPHLWLDPERMAAIASPLAEAMGEAMPEGKTTWVMNARVLAQHLRADVTPALKTLLQKNARTTNSMERAEIPFITYHAAYQYFLGRFGLENYGQLTQGPEERMGTRSKSRLLNQAENVQVRCLIGEQGGVLIERIAKSTGAKLILLSPEQLVDRATLGPVEWAENDYDRFLYATAKAFAGCL